MKKVLIHVCCGVCASFAIQKLKSEGFSVEAFFFNPNIHPRGEYLKRREVMNIVADKQKIKVVEGCYDVPLWFNICKDDSNQIEGGARCVDCYSLRLKETFNYCLQKEYDYFTTTLTISPHKSSMSIIEVGCKIGDKKFLPYDFKKEGGFAKTIDIAKKNNLYRQNYCGCVYSRTSRIKDNTR